MVRPNDRTKGGSLDIVFPFSECSDYSQEFAVINLVVLFSRVEREREKSGGMFITVRIFLDENSACCEQGSVSFDNEWLGVIRYE